MKQDQELLHLLPHNLFFLRKEPFSDFQILLNDFIKDRVTVFHDIRITSI